MTCTILFNQGESFNNNLGVSYNAFDSHVWDCIYQFRMWNSMPLYVITDQKENKKLSKIYNIDWININDIDIDIEKYNKIQPCKTESNNLIYSSYIRFCYIEELIKSKNLTNIFTFDNDVLVYTDLDEFRKRYVLSKIVATKHSESEFTSGMMFIENIDCLNQMNNFAVNFRTSESVSEMKMLGSFYKNGNILKRFNTSFNYNGDFGPNQIIFDPSSYGQFIDGCDNGTPSGTLHFNQILSYEIKNAKDFKIVELKDCNKRCFGCVVNNQVYKFGSLHMHSKRLKRYLSI